MAGRIEDYAVVGDEETVALVGRDGSVDWMCLPRFDSAACFAALLGDQENGHWTIAPAGGGTASSRRYLDGTLVLESTWETDSGTVRVLDFMPHRAQAADLVRVVEGIRGEVDMRMVLRLRFEYGHRVPWMHRSGAQIVAVAGPDAVYLSSDVPVRGEQVSSIADFTVSAGERLRFELTHRASHLPPPRPVPPDRALDETVASWREWSGHCRPVGEWTPDVVASLVTLKALTYEPTGGIVAAATTSLPEDIGGERNWDYRYCWLRDATMTLEALLRAGYVEEASAWRSWLLRAVAGSPQHVQIMYGIAGESRLTEYDADWLSGYEGSRPVRIGNAAAHQLQLDVFGEVVEAVAMAERHGVDGGEETWAVLVELVTYLQDVWRRPDSGLWEMRGPLQHFTHSKVMCWVAFDRMAALADRRGDDRASRWRHLAETVHAEVCERSWNAEVGAYTQAYDSTALDAAVLLMVRTGFLPPEDPRMQSTLDVVGKGLSRDGLLLRYQQDGSSDGLSGEESPFLACSFWYAEALQLAGRTTEARELFERLLGLRNDVGLLSEEYDPSARRQLGNVPQAFSHIGLVMTAFALAGLPPMVTEER